jgi:autotransporter-associated beta strand protein
MLPFYISAYCSISFFHIFFPMHSYKTDIPDNSAAADVADKQTGGLPPQAIVALLPLAGLLAFGQPALAVDAAWSPTPADGDFNNDVNWVGGNTPDGVATFGASTETDLSFSTGTTIGALTIDSGAYSFTNAAAQLLQIDGAGITVNGGSASIINNGDFYFENSSIVGTADITNNSNMRFEDTSTAGNADILNNGSFLAWQSSTMGSATITNDGTMQIAGTATGGNAAFVNNNGAGLSFHDTSTAEDSTITNDGDLSFWDSSTVGDAVVTNHSGGVVDFFDSSTTGDSTITNDGDITFWNSSTAGDATITTTSGGDAEFLHTSNGGNAQFITQAGGTFGISNLGSAGTTAGSIEGAGDYVLGAKNLEVGSNDLSTEVSGVISGVGGSLTKVGSGTLLLSGTNTYTGATTVDDGTLEISGSIASATLDVNAGGTLNYTGASDAGTATITNDNGATLSFQDSSTAGDATFMNNGGLTFQDNSSADNATIVDNGDIWFRNNSTAGDATITNNSGLAFLNSSTAGTAVITNNNVAQFADSSTAGDAVISNSGGMSFSNNSSAGNATITNNNVSNLSIVDNATAADATITNNYDINFWNSATAGDATITNNKWLTFRETTTAGDATITITNGGTTSFLNTASGGDARFITQSGGTFDSSNLSSGGTTAGSIEGAGSYVLGNKNLTVGSNDLSTAVSGVISGVGGSLTKTGSGTLELSGTNTYTGDTVVDDGTLQIGSSIASSIVDINTGGTLLYTDSADAGSATITNDSVTRFENSSTAGSAAIDNNVSLELFNSSDAGTSTITNDGFFRFNNLSTAGDATLTNNVNLYFVNSASAGDATVTTTNGGSTQIDDIASGGDATFITQNGGTFNISGLSSSGTTAGSIEGAGSYVLGAKNLEVGSNDLSTTVSGVISGAGGSLTKVGTGTLVLSGTNTYTGATTVANGTLWITGSIASATVDVSAGGTLAYAGSGSSGSATITNHGGINFWNASTADDAAITNDSGASMAFFSNSTAENATIANAGVLHFLDNSTAADATVTTNSGGHTRFFNTSSSGHARFIANVGGTFDISGLSSGGTTVGSIEGAGDFVLGNNNLEVGSNDLDTTVSGVLSGVGGSFTKTGNGTLNLTGVNTYTGATDVDDGTLRVNGSLASSLTTINSGATLGGTGALGNITINGGTLAPGNSIGTITVNGDLIFGPGSTYDIEVSPTDADRTDVTGFATLDGTVQATFEAGSYMERDYTILSAAGGLGGSTFDSLSTINLPSGFAASLDYSGNDVLLTLEATFTPPAGGLGRNQQNVADAVTVYFNDGGTLPPEFVTLFALTGDELNTALSQISGEAAAAARQSARQAMNQFMNLMSAPRSTGNAAADKSTAFGAMPVRAVPIGYAVGEEVLPTGPEEQPWTAWASSFGGGSGVDGDGAEGSHDVSASAFGFAAGIDYQATRKTTLGLAFSGGSTSWSLSDNLGGGTSQDYQVGLNGAVRWEKLYAMAALAYGFHRMSTERLVPGGDLLTSDFDAQSLSGRIESGARFKTRTGSFITPYAALQAQAYLVPDYGEDDPGGSGFALSYGERFSTSTRAEFGARFDHLLNIGDATRLNLGARLAYAHDWIGDPALTASFQSLPGASFTVNGAAPPTDLGLASLGAEILLDKNLSLLARFEGAFAPGVTSCAGIGTIRYTW